ncbi:MAG: DUF7507 domain-containing protein [Planctomycetota bacterium]
MYSTKKSTIAAGVAALLLILGVFVSPSPAPIPPPCIDVWKWVEPDVSKIGDDVVYTICVNNCGVMHLLNVVVADPHLGGVLPGFPPVLAPGETVCLDFPYTIQPGDPDPLVNVVTASGTNKYGVQVEDADTATVDLVKVGIDITKTVDNPNPCFGDTVTYTICIKNTGEWPLEHVVVMDPHLGGILPGFPAVLAPGETVCIDFPYVVQDDDPCPLVNCAKVRSDPLGPMTNCVKDEDCARICPEHCGGGDEGCTPGFWKNHPGCWCGLYHPDDLIGSVFDLGGLSNDLNGDGKPDTLMDALKYKGGKGAEGAARNLLRHAVAALLNACDPDVDYPLSLGEVKELVKIYVETPDRGGMLALKDFFDALNNLGCPIDAHCRPHPED